MNRYPYLTCSFSCLYLTNLCFCLINSSQYDIFRKLCHRIMPCIPRVGRRHSIDERSSREDALMTLDSIVIIGLR